MEILSVGGCPYEDNEGEVLNLHVKLEEDDMLVLGGNISIVLMDDTVIEREIKIINPKLAGDYAAVSEKAKQWKQSGETLQEIKGPALCDVVVTNVAYHDVKTDEEISNRAFLEEMEKIVCISPFREIDCGDESIYDYVEEGYSVPDKVITYLQTTKPFIMCPGIYEHPFKAGTELLGPYMYTDGNYCWDRDTWKYVVKYHVKLPQEFIEHVMSEEGTRFIEECMEEEESWPDTIRQWKENQEGLCLLPDDAGDKELDDF